MTSSARAATRIPAWVVAPCSGWSNAQAQSRGRRHWDNSMHQVCEARYCERGLLNLYQNITVMLYLTKFCGAYTLWFHTQNRGERHVLSPLSLGTETQNGPFVPHHPDLA